MDTTYKTLEGKRIVLTRPPEEAGILLHKLNGSGAQVFLLPFIEFRPPEDFALLDSAVSHLSEFDWIVFTSQNAVRFFCNRLRELGRVPVDLPVPPRVAVIGAATSSAAAVERLRVDLVTPGARSGREFVAEFSPNAQGKKILLPQSDQAGGQVAEGLRAAGAQVTPVVAYRTCMPESLDGAELARIRRDGADVFVFASPSAFRNFARIVGDADLKRFAAEAAFAAIGPTTAQAIRKAGVPVEIEAVNPNADEIIKAMIEYFSRVHRVKECR
jgi:uroporphyrinogen-III synthase